MSAGAMNVAAITKIKLSSVAFKYSIPAIFLAYFIAFEIEKFHEDFDCFY